MFTINITNITRNRKPKLCGEVGSTVVLFILLKNALHTIFAVKFIRHWYIKKVSID